MKPKLTIELVPSSSWFKNLRSELETDEWDKIRRQCYRNANYRCEICGGKGPKHPVECHEIWDYDENKGIQKLVGLIALCPPCHRVKHPGLAKINGYFGKVIYQLMKVNKMTKSAALNYVEDAFEIWESRSRRKWTLDLSVLEEMK